jgi:hypothetical protein
MDKKIITAFFVICIMPILTVFYVLYSKKTIKFSNQPVTEVLSFSDKISSKTQTAQNLYLTPGWSYNRKTETISPYKCYIEVEPYKKIIK